MRPQRSLETKWAMVQHAVSKFSDVYATMCDLNESGTNEEDCVEKAKILYQQSSKAFAFMECWRVLYSASKWQTQSIPG